MRKDNALFGMYGVSAVEFAAPDRPDLCVAIRQSRTSHGRAYRGISRRVGTATGCAYRKAVACISAGSGHFGVVVRSIGCLRPHAGAGLVTIGPFFSAMIVWWVDGMLRRQTFPWSRGAGTSAMPFSHWPVLLRRPARPSSAGGPGLF